MQAAEQFIVRPLAQSKITPRPVELGAGLRSLLLWVQFLNGAPNIPSLVESSIGPSKPVCESSILSGGSNLGTRL